MFTPITVNMSQTFFLNLFLVGIGLLLLATFLFFWFRKKNKKTKFSKQITTGSSLQEILGSTQKQFSLALGQAAHDKDLQNFEEKLYECDLSPKVIYNLTQKAAQEAPDFSISKLKQSFKKNMLNSLLESSCLEWKNFKSPQIWLFVGVNGAGKTTTLSKVAHQAKENGLKVLIVAGDTFRAAAREQLALWASRLELDILMDEKIKDPAALAHKALERCQSYDLILFDTAGRLQNKLHLMDELKKVKRVLMNKSEVYGLKGFETLLVLDGSSGRNALSQAEIFHKEIGVSALIMSKLDGSFKGGALISVSEELKIPVAALGTGETLTDLKIFNSSQFVNFIL